MQNQPWRPPDFPQAPILLDVTANLFKLGFPDPRGCEYREFEAFVVDQGQGILFERGAMSLRKMEGWVLPRVTWKRRRVAIGWDGVIYRAETVGKDCDLRAYVTKTVRERDKSGLIATPIETFLLLRLGETELAATMLPSGPEEMPGSFQDAARDWGESLFQMGLCSHIQGHDAQAEAYLREWDQVADRLGATDRAAFSDEQRRNVKSLIADQTRRRLEYEGASRSLRRAQRIRDQRARIDALIELLDEVNIQAIDNPGRPDLANDPIVQALAGEGLAAFPPLLQAFELDRRLTRSVSYWRFQSTLGEVMTASDAAAAALDTLLGERGRAELNDSMAAQNLSPKERTGATLTFLREWWKRNAPAM